MAAPHPLQALNLILFLLATPFSASESTPTSWPCQDHCGSLPVRYPLGTGPGCGDPRFAASVSCKNNQFLFTTHTGSYPILSIDYAQSRMLVSDPRMSTCMAMQSSSGFALDWAAPFQLDGSVFALLACNDPSRLVHDGSSLCDMASSHICSSLGGCAAMSTLGVQPFSPEAASTCCVYAPINLGPAHEVNLTLLGCKGYAAVAGFGDTPTDPARWSYGVALHYSYGLGNGYLPAVCDACQRSGGACGYAGTSLRVSFVCVCKTGVNTTSDCYAQQGLWGGGFRRGASVLGLVMTGSFWAAFMAAGR
ncbi:hypothetical protein AMTRI_Chr09g14670 [Amborella trichopoda]